MSETTKVAISRDNAILLLDAADELKVDRQSVVVSDGVFVAPSEVADKAGLTTPKEKTSTKRTARGAAKKAAASSQVAESDDSKKEDD